MILSPGTVTGMNFTTKTMNFPRNVFPFRTFSQLTQSGEEFVIKLLDRRRWVLDNPHTKLHKVMFSMNKTIQRNELSLFSDVNFSIDVNPIVSDGDDVCNGCSFYVVRDDLLHPLVNGNKPRKLDGLLPIIRDCSGTDVVTCGGCQSAHAAAVAVMCAERGLRSHLLLRGEEPEILTGYNLVSTIYGNVVYVPRSVYAKREEMLVEHANAIAGPSGSVVWFADILNRLIDPSDKGNSLITNVNKSLEDDGTKKVVIVQEGAGDVVALLGIIRLVQYLSQSHVLGKDRPYNLVIDAGTGTTAIGFALGIQLLGLPWKVTAIMLADTFEGYKAQEHRLISDFKRYYKYDLVNHALKNELVHWVCRSTPRKFGNVLDGEVKACQQVANQTGVFIDPIYTLAAWEMAVHLSQKKPQDGAEVVMLHTGGTLGMFGLAQRYKSHFRTLKNGPTK